MAEDFDTQETSEEATEPMGSEVNQEPEEDLGSENVEEVSEQQQVEPELTDYEKKMNDLRAWQGRREAELKTEIGSQIEDLKAVILQQQQQLAQVNQPQPAEPEWDYDDPLQSVDSRVEQVLTQREQAQQKYQETVQTTWADTIKKDPAFLEDTPDGPKPTEWGTEVFNVLNSGDVQINTEITDPVIAAKLALAEAKDIVIRKRELERRKPKNPLAGNKPKTQVQGGVAPPSGKAKAVSMPDNLDAQSQKLIDEWGLTPEQVQEYLSR